VPVREVIEIDEALCDGCGECVPACEEGAIRIVDGKARLVSEVYCDGLGACLGRCPRGAIRIVRREAPAFDEEAVRRHLAGIRGATGPELPLVGAAAPAAAPACPGSRPASFEPVGRPVAGASALAQWPVQLHLLPPTAPFLAGRELVLAADCAAYAAGDFHARYLAGRSLAIACPKLDAGQDRYLEKLALMVRDGGVTGIHVITMEVPCCSGLLRLAEAAVRVAGAAVAVRCTVLGVRGEPLGTPGGALSTAG